MLAVALALGASLSWGVCDYVGALKSRALPVLTVLAISQVSGFLVVALLVAVSRPYLGVHYPSDVVAGLLAGGLWADAVIIGWRLAARLTARKASERG